MGKQISYYNYFYLPEAGELVIEYWPGDGSERVGERLHRGGTAIIEAGYSFIGDNKRITRARIYSYSGYYNENSEWIPRSKQILKLYNRLARVVKYITPYCLQLRESEGYKLG